MVWPHRVREDGEPRRIDPDDGDGDPVRTGDIIPDIAVDPNSGQLYAVWQDKRFSEGFSAGTTVSRSRPRPTAALAGRPP